MKKDSELLKKIEEFEKRIKELEALPVVYQFPTYYYPPYYQWPNFYYPPVPQTICVDRNLA